MNVVKGYNIVIKCVKHLRKKCGDNIEYIEVYDGKLTIQFKREYCENKNAEKSNFDTVRSVLNATWGTGVTKEEAVNILLEMMCGYATFSQRLAIGKAVYILKQPEIIRCRDCKYYPYCEREIDDPDGYCSCAYPKNKVVKNER